MKLYQIIDGVILHYFTMAVQFIILRLEKQPEDLNIENTCTVEPRQFELEGTSSTIRIGKVFELLNRNKNFFRQKFG